MAFDLTDPIMAEAVHEVEVESGRTYDGHDWRNWVDTAGRPNPRMRVPPSEQARLNERVLAKYMEKRQRAEAEAQAEAERQAELVETAQAKAERLLELLEAAQTEATQQREFADVAVAGGGRWGRAGRLGRLAVGAQSAVADRRATSPVWSAHGGGRAAWWAWVWGWRCRWGSPRV